IDVILIDEFQDTDPLQLDIAFALAADDPALPPPWPEVVLRPGKILLVGDPKQSIYRFRGADISLWDRTKRLFPHGVEQLGRAFGTRACRPARFNDIATLVPTRTPRAQLERALDTHDVPYRVESRSLVWATDAVRELLAVLSAIDDPADDIAVVAALRSPGFAC